jgi:hypothetical protein
VGEQGHAADEGRGQEVNNDQGDIVYYNPENDPDFVPPPKDLGRLASTMFINAFGNAVNVAVSQRKDQYGTHAETHEAVPFSATHVVLNRGRVASIDAMLTRDEAEYLLDCLRKVLHPDSAPLCSD